jgi:hypothetical protein
MALMPWFAVMEADSGSCMLRIFMVAHPIIEMAMTLDGKTEWKVEYICLRSSR